MTEGERWTRELLARLRRSGFRPSGWGQFVAHSFVRARETRRRRRREHRETLAIGAIGSMVWLLVALTGRPSLGLVAGGWWLLVIVMLNWHLGMLDRPDGTTIRGLGPANAITLLRAGLIPAFFFLSPAAIGMLLLCAGTTDALDGWLARRRGQVTRLGRWMDGSVDGLLLGASALNLTPDRLQAELAALVILRIALPWIAATVFYFTHAQTPPVAGVVSWRIPGMLLWLGLALVAFEIPAAGALVAGGIIGGLAGFTATVVKTRRLSAAGVRKATG